MKRIRKLVLGLVIASTLAFSTPARAQNPTWDPGWFFTNCVQIWWYERCYEVWVSDPTSSDFFQAMYSLCQLVGLCP